MSTTAESSVSAAEEAAKHAPPKPLKTQFSDKEGRIWDLRLTHGTVRKIVQDGHNFHELAEKNCRKFLELDKDDEKLLKWLWWACKATNPDRNPEVSEREFIDESFDGATLNEAWEVFGDAYVNFTRDPAIASGLRDAFVANREAQEKSLEAFRVKTRRMVEIAKEEQEKILAKMDEPTMRRMLAQQMPSELSGVMSASSDTPPS